MADVTDIVPPGIFWGTNNAVNPQVRQAIALAMLSRKQQPYPKTVGEGLSAIGNSLGDVGMMRRLEASDIAAQKIGAAGADEAPPAATPAPPAATPAPQASAAPTTQTSDAGSAAGAVPRIMAMSDDSDEAPAQPVATPQPAAGPSVQEATAANSLVNPQRNAMANALVQQAAGGPQANPTVAGDSPVSQVPSSAAPTPTVVSDIPKAPDIALRPGMQLAQGPQPPAAQPQPAPATPVYPPGYVMPKPLAPVPPSVMPTPIEQKYIDWKNRNIGNIYVEQRANQIIAQEQAKRAQQQEQFKLDYANFEAMQRLYEEQRASAEQRGLTAAESRQKLNEPKLQEDVETKYYWDPAAGAYRIPQVVGQDPNAPPRTKLSEYQGNSVKYANQMFDASFDIDPTALTNRKDAVASSIPLIHSWAEGQGYKGAQGAAVRWVMGKLRSESGATINPEEFAREYKSFIPVAGDGPEIIAQKAKARATAMEGMSAASGPGRANIDYHVRQDVQDQKRMSDEMDQMAKAIGKPIVPGKVYINPDQPGKSRVFIGGRWREY
jgi:hypothetical protein